MNVPNGYRGDGVRVWMMVGVYRSACKVDLPPLGILHALQFVTAKETGEQMVHVEKIEPPDFLQVADYRREVDVPPETVLSIEIEYIERTPVPRPKCGYGAGDMDPGCPRSLPCRKHPKVSAN